VPTATLEGLKERTITISSIGKTLSFTGWKIGWACAPSSILKSIHNLHQFVNFCVNHPLQIAMQNVIPEWDDYLVEFQHDYKERRQRLLIGLQERGFRTFVPHGTYFLLCQTPEGQDDWSFCRYLIDQHRVATIPLSPFYYKSMEGQSLIRFCFAKTNQVLDSALENLKGVAR
jgi:N-succinyldiaminopimelate aminotransferase